MNPQPTAACSLSDVKLRDRVRFIDNEILCGVTATTELEDGYEFCFPGDDTWFRKLTDFIAFERTCCSFLQFELVVMPNHGPILLRLRGGDRVKEFVQEVQMVDQV